MSMTFEQIEPEKRERILNAALDEFSHNSYKNASTNGIVKKAGISKGLLFHYFNSKKEFYLSVYQYFLAFILEEYYKKIDADNKDILLRLRQSIMLKLEIFQKYPLIYRYLIRASIETDGDIYNEMTELNNNLKISGYAKAFSDVDTSKFTDGIDTAKAINLIIWSLEGYAYSLTGKYDMNNIDSALFEKIVAEIDTYIDVLEKSFYK